MNKRGICARFLLPLLAVTGTMALSGLVYHGSSSMTPGAFRSVITDVSGGILFLSIWFFAFAGTPLAYFRGASFAERFIVAFANPGIWLARMASTVSCQFTAVEMVYFFLLPWTFGAVCVTLFEFSLSEMVCRWIDRRRGTAGIRVFHPLVTVLLLAGLAGTYVGLVRGQEWAYKVVHHYADHFEKGEAGR